MPGEPIPAAAAAAAAALVLVGVLGTERRITSWTVSRYEVIRKVCFFCREKKSERKLGGKN